MRDGPERDQVDGVDRVDGVDGVDGVQMRRYGGKLRSGSRT